MLTGLFVGWFALSGCVFGDKYDGSYRYELKIKSDECDDGTDAGGGDVQVGMLSVYHTTTGAMAMTVGDLTLVGENDKADFEVSHESGWDNASCDTYTFTQNIEIDGEFTPDLGIDADLTVTTRTVRDDCEYLDDDDVTCEMKASLSAVQLNVDTTRHHHSANWGYSPSYF